MKITPINHSESIESSESSSNSPTSASDSPKITPINHSESVESSKSSTGFTLLVEFGCNGSLSELPSTRPLGLIDITTIQGSSLYVIRG